LTGLSVTIKRTQSGTLTDANGNFTIRGVLQIDTLVVSYIGYKRAFIHVGNQTNFKIELKETDNKLDEVVIQAYGETTQRTTTGDIGTVTAKDIEKQPVTNVLTALQGQIPGVVVTNSSGYTSGGISVDIRGRNTIGSFPVDPLYIVDGVPLTILNVGETSSPGTPTSTTMADVYNPAGGQSPFFNMNPSDVESITVLKDADATAIYGSRGANGVILITTKKGKAGKAHFDISVYDGQSNLSQGYQMLNSQQYVKCARRP
jgi:TonB-dependent SusC/RagA subfamily outer membrane receptor